MIKIIISGTYDGFSPRYSSDSILDDQISTHLLDRRRFLSREADRLYKEGYSFQPLAGGILFHKIILLYDGFGRDGFMMVSLFLPEGELLGGTDIKETLDAIIRDYKVRIQNGIANVELDWSFVKGKADELNAKVQSIPWKKKPSYSDPSKTALIHGAENREADFFQYPNPLNSGCSGYGQVFLTESLLDPAMASNDGEQGYKVLNTDDVDIDNPEYTIIYENQQQGAKLSGERKTITKKELDSHPGNFLLGTLSKPGYRSAEVMIKEADKTSKDGFTIIVTLPNLVQKKATVKIDVYDNDNADMSIPEYRCSFKWAITSSGQSKLIQPHDGVFSFYGEDCDTRWNYTIECESYETHSGEIYILDGKSETKKILLKPKPLWNIYIQLPNGDTKLNKSAVSEDDLQYYTQKAESYLKNNGLDIDKSTRDDAAHKITIVGKKEAVSNNDGISGGSNHQSDISNNTNTDENETVTKYFIRLDSKSKDYSLFKNYVEKLKLEENNNKYIQKLEAAKKQIKNDYAKKLVKIVEALRSNNAEQAKEALDSLKEADHNGNFANSKLGENIIIISTNAINSIKKWRSIPKVVKKPEDVEYNPKKHRLECERKEKPNIKDKVYLQTDRYKYTISHQIWNRETPLVRTEESVVERDLLQKYKLLYCVLGAVLVMVLAFAAYSIFFNKGEKHTTELKSEIGKCIESMNLYPKCYCDDSIFNIAQEVKSNYDNLVAKKPDLSNDSICIVFVDLFEKQREYKTKDSILFNKGLELFDAPIEEFDLGKWHEIMQQGDVLTKAHRDILNKKDEDRVLQIQEEQSKAAEINSYEQCKNTSGSKRSRVDRCNQFINDYPNSEWSNEVKGIRQKLLAKLEPELYSWCFNESASVSKCDEYLKYYSDPNNQHVKDVKKQKEDLKRKSNNDKKEPFEGQKKTISSPDELFNTLTWDVVKQGQPNFNNKYSIESNNPTLKNTLTTNAKKIIEKAVKLPGSLEKKGEKYNQAYNEAKSSSTVASKRIEKLIELL